MNSGKSFRMRVNRMTIKAKEEPKKAVVFIVEGNSDKKALEKIFQKIYNHKDIVFKFMDGDITSDENVDKSNVEDIIYEKVDEYRKYKKLYKRDILEIVHIFDTDGTYIPSESIVKGTTSHFLYTEKQISCKNVDAVKERNEKKSAMMDYLLGLDKIKGIRYVGYFMSSNLDHSLYNEQNLSDELKGEYADAFYEAFQGKEKLFVDFLTDEVANGVPDIYPASWRYIKEGVHSLERHTNLHLYFKDNPY